MNLRLIVVSAFVLLASVLICSQSTTKSAVNLSKEATKLPKYNIVDSKFEEEDEYATDLRIVDDRNDEGMPPRTLRELRRGGSSGGSRGGRGSSYSSYSSYGGYGGYGGYGNY